MDKTNYNPTLRDFVTVAVTLAGVVEVFRSGNLYHNNLLIYQYVLSYCIVSYNPDGPTINQHKSIVIIVIIQKPFPVHY